MEKKKTLIRITGILLSILLVMVFISCDDDDDDNGITGPEVGSQSGTFAYDGGTIQYGNLQMDIPVGTLTDTVEITVGIPETPPNYTEITNYERIADIYSLQPMGIMLSDNVYITISYDETTLDNMDETNLTIMIYTAASETPVVLGNVQVFEDQNQVQGEADVFGYVFLAYEEQGPTEPPVPPTPLQPPNGDDNLPLTFTMRWSAVDNAYDYDLQIATDSDFMNMFLEAENMTQTSRQIGGLAPATRYHWRVRAGNSQGQSPWSEIFIFNTAEGTSGDLVGSWVFDRGEFNFELPGDTLDFSISSSGDEIVSFTDADWEAQGNIDYTYTYSYSIGGFSFDTSWTQQEYVDAGGTYETNGNIITVNTTWSNTPDTQPVGTTETMDYFINGDQLRFNWGYEYTYPWGVDSLKVDHYYMRQP